MKPRSSIPHISALDGARGAAVAGVLLFHGGHLVGGYLGVDLFFTLSGFLITSLLLAEVARFGSVGLGGFWARRARRLLPALVVLMLGIVAFCRFVATPQELTQIRGDALATLAYGANWRAVFAHQSYFALFSAPSPLQHTWSLAIEEQFYVVWPLAFVALAAAFRRAVPKAVLVTSLVLAAGSSALMIALYSRSDTNRVYYGTDTRAAAILLGVALAAWLAWRGPARARSARVALEALGLAGVAVLAVAWTRLDGQSPRLYRGGFLVCGLAATAVIAAATHPRRGPIARALSWRPLCALGLVSYGVYLYHWPLDIVLDRTRVGLAGWPLFGVQTAVTLDVAIVSYRYIEQPIRHGAFTAAQWRTLTPAIAAALVAALVLASTLGAKSEDIPTTLANPLRAATLAFQRSPRSTRVLIVGNSVADFLARHGFAAIAGHHDPPLDVLNGSVAGCIFPPEITGLERSPAGTVVRPPPCDPAWETGVVARYRPDLVFWVMGDPIADNLTYNGQPVSPCTQPYDTVYAQGLEREVSRLGATGAHVVVLTAAYARYAGHRPDRLADCDNRIRRTVASTTDAQLIDLAKYVCPDHTCRTEQDGVVLRPDGEHYKLQGAQLIAEWLMDHVERG